MTASVRDQDVEADRRHRVSVEVNDHKVRLEERRMTGLEIKQTAIAQGAELEIDFQLSVKKKHRYKIVGDNDTVKVKEGMEFVAVAGDDNS